MSDFYQTGVIGMFHRWRVRLEELEETFAQYCKALRECAPARGKEGVVTGPCA